MKKHDYIIERAISVLLLEHRVLLSGNLMELEKLMIKKEQFRDELKFVDINKVSEERVLALRSQVEVNTSLFEAARAGLMAAKQRVAMISDNLTGFQVYRSDHQVDVLQNSKSGQTV